MLLNNWREKMNNKVLFASRVLVGNELTPILNGCIVIVDGKIEKITTQENFLNENTNADYEKIDLGDCTVMPGMIDCHNHLSLDARLHGHLDMMNICSEAELTVMAIKSMKDDLMSGVTTARCLGDRNYIDVCLKKQVEKGNVIGPNLLVCGIGMRSIHGHGYVGLPHSGVEEVRRTARENMAQGVDLLKIFITAGAPPMNGGWVPYFMTYEEMKTVVDEGKQLNLNTSAHCVGGEGLKIGVKAGVEIFEHVYCATDDELELIQKNDRWIDLTSGIFLDPSREQFCPESFVKNVHKNRELVFNTLKKVVKNGMKFSLGTDAYHTFLYREVEYANQLGASVVDSIKGVTVNAAIMCGIQNKTGSIAENLAADIIAVKGNPLENVSCLSQVTFVMKDGKVYKM